ncbi:hypothetical protein [Halomonas denitrificans]|nr:hypothetical protein [Halomonas denitrificans]
MTVAPSSRRRLAAMDIDVWVRRDREPAAGTASDAAAQASSGSASGSPTGTGVDCGTTGAPSRAAAGPRIRLASGRGRWLLLIDDAGAAEDQRFLDDLRGLLGIDQVRFGRWSDSAESGVAAEDWPERGIEWVLDFGGGSVEHPAVLNLPRLTELRESGSARKALWQALRPLLPAA